ncbi:MAG: hypothetical protein ACOYOV_12060 [Bacteroidales bacterium]
MIYTPRFIIFSAVINYLSEEQIVKLKNDLGKSDLKQDRRFLSIIKKHFDTNLLKDKSYIWQDIWLYNYLKYDVKSRFPRKGVIAKYEKEITIPFVKITKEVYDIIGILNQS